MRWSYKKGITCKGFKKIKVLFCLWRHKGNHWIYDRWNLMNWDFKMSHYDLGLECKVCAIRWHETYAEYSDVDKRKIELEEAQADDA